MFAQDEFISRGVYENLIRFYLQCKTFQIFQFNIFEVNYILFLESLASQKCLKSIML